MFKKYLSLIKFSHTIFAMPFAIAGFALGVRLYGFEWEVLLLVVVAMVFARSAAMGFNRIVDREFDARNARTAVREIPSGAVSEKSAAWLVALCCIGFVVTSLFINVLAFALSPVALAVILGYSYTKRFTSWCHIVLGLALAIAPMGGYIAVTGSFALPPLLLCGLVLTWVAGFDVIFALQDVEFDRSEDLHSIPARLGVKNGLLVSAALHLISVAFVVIIGFVIDSNPLLYWIGAAIFIALLAFQHAIVKPTDLSRVGLAFGTTNGLASIAYATFLILSLFI